MADPVDNAADVPPVRGEMQERLAVFLGDWRAEGTSYGGTDQTSGDPRANGEAWVSTHTGRWHSGEFFLVQDERALPGGNVFDTIGVLGVDPETGGYASWSFENHGFHRRYDVTVDGDVWSFSGEHERATITFSDGGRTQTHVWEWRPGDEWLPLCERTAIRQD